MEENTPILDMFGVQSETKHCKYQYFIRTQKPVQGFHAWNALIQTQRRSPECNKTRMQLYQEWSPKNKQQNLGVRIFEGLCAFGSIAQATGMSLSRTGLLDKVQALHRPLMLLGQCLKSCTDPSSIAMDQN